MGPIRVKCQLKFAILLILRNFRSSISYHEYVIGVWFQYIKIVSKNYPSWNKHIKHLCQLDCLIFQIFSYLRIHYNVVLFLGIENLIIQLEYAPGLIYLSTTCIFTCFRNRERNCWAEYGELSIVILQTSKRFICASLSRSSKLVVTICCPSLEMVA